MEKIYDFYQEGRLLFTGDKEHLAEMTGLAKSTINNYCRPGFFDDKKNETKIKVVEITGTDGESK